MKLRTFVGVTIGLLFFLAPFALGALLWWAMHPAGLLANIAAFVLIFIVCVPVGLITWLFGAAIWSVT